MDQKKQEQLTPFLLLVDLRGIEPLSESLSLAASPITVDLFTFPYTAAERQAAVLSSFIKSSTFSKL